MYQHLTLSDAEETHLLSIAHQSGWRCPSNNANPFFVTIKAWFQARLSTRDLFKNAKLAPKHKVHEYCIFLAVSSAKEQQCYTFHRNQRGTKLSAWKEYVPALLNINIVATSQYPGSPGNPTAPRKDEHLNRYALYTFVAGLRNVFYFCLLWSQWGTEVLPSGSHTQPTFWLFKMPSTSGFLRKNNQILHAHNCIAEWIQNLWLQSLGHMQPTNTFWTISWAQLHYN